MSRSSSTGRHDGITSFGAFAIALAGLVLALFVFYIMFSRRGWLRAASHSHAAQIPAGQSPSPESQQDVTTTDLETGISETSSSDAHANSHGTLFFRTRKALQHHSSQKSIRRKKAAEEAQRPVISTPIRMLPLDSPYIFVQSPLQPNSQVLTQSRLPMETTLRPRRSRSLTLPESRPVLGGPTGILKHKDRTTITDAEEAQQHAAIIDAEASLPRGLRKKRTIVWFDEPSDDDDDDLASVRTFRSNSLPSSTHSSWESTPGHTMIDEEPLHQRTQKTSLGSVTQLWLVYQSKTKGG